MLDYRPPSSEALIEREYQVRKPNGEIVRVNRFDFNLASCADKDCFIQCSDLGWMRVGNLEIIR
jgi:hypothetical protein